MKKIISMAMAFVMIVMLWGCAPKKTTEVAPIAPLLRQRQLKTLLITI